MREGTWKQQRNGGPAGGEDQWAAAGGVEEPMKLTGKMKSGQWRLASERAIQSAKPSSSQILRCDCCEDAIGVVLGLCEGFRFSQFGAVRCTIVSLCPQFWSVGLFGRLLCFHYFLLLLLLFNFEKHGLHVFDLIDFF